MIKLGSIDKYDTLDNFPFEYEGVNYLLLHTANGYSCIENKCGHFGVALTEGSVEDEAILCPIHGISFDIHTGEKRNRPYEIAESVRTVALEIMDNEIYFEPLPVLEE